MRIHYTQNEKIDLLEIAARLNDSSLFELASILDCCTFAELKRISQAIEIMAKGKKDGQW